MNPEPCPPRIYDAAEALRFVACWTGLDMAVVEPILDAKFCYLELAGLVQSEEDDALLREREVYRHLLPETPTFIDERERDYLALMTGLDQDILLKIEQGELAYQDSLDIIGWDDEADRDARLGAPNCPNHRTHPCEPHSSETRASTSDKVEPLGPGDRATQGCDPSTEPGPPEWVGLESSGPF